MMAPVLRVDGSAADPCMGSVRVDWPKALWNTGMLIGTILAVAVANWQSILLFIVLTYASLLIGHSVGMHRMMIHRSFKAPLWLARSLIYVGTLVGVSGPSGIIRIHDTRDWAQRQRACHDFFAHRCSLLVDLFWNLFCRFEFVHAPRITIEPDIAEDPFYRFLDTTWRLHQLPIALLLYWAGGWPFVLWGICARVFVSSTGHWTITYFCHTSQRDLAKGRWLVKDAGIQAANIPGFGLITYGECWHNNHHAFPESARIGLDEGQADPGWWIINGLAKCGLAYDIGAPRAAASRSDLVERAES
ncbi:acyl-CoA desaturase [Qipengyuania sp. DGS5-3]|uniref:acyl-CoA desaturase n=1 Tax=Qipengyuania sp. DGS5-3 TaxID=3349632 RepID=UPI0036D23256